ncbi:beta-ketoacyl-ACP synthase II [Aneurinibacillus aneurinilyticus]|uniref:beta-ketoacyl-ACP synthase II n=1 Tax=Aneurinibacillus aneurinilyticus TaxID=1391 RepID=UPI0023F68BFD|nr:beta-ketoacyl-ACP synthase II [Aneurinibacillus aneurinilyticus]MCI1696823.1 beta-ketoacyl-ACP synthase II [Aneurinibacillus aneurinilyticus]
MSRVVITGMGVITPLGNDVRSFWSNLVAGHSGISYIDSFDVSCYKTKIAGVVRDFNPETIVGRREVRRMDRFCQFAVAAAKQALEDASLNIEQENTERIGVYVGSGIGGVQTLLENYRTLLSRGPGRVSPTVVPMMLPSMAAAQVSILFGIKGPTLAPVTACATGNNAIGEAYKLIQRGGADIIIAGGSEAAVTDLALAGFGNATALSTRNEEPGRASRPFDADRDGFVASEGAGILVLESLEHAQQRGARIHAEIIGYGSTSDAYHMVATDPEGMGAYRAMKEAIEDAGIALQDIDYINAHATSTGAGDRSETLAIKQLFGSHAYQVPISANKSMLGHMLGAAGGVEAVALVRTLQENMIPPTINLETPDPECDLDYVPNLAREARLQIGLSSSFGFGGHNAVLVLKKFDTSSISA